VAKFTVFGSSGFVGSHLVRHLQAQGHDVSAPARGSELQGGQAAGHVIYCIGLTGDFRVKLFETVDAHVSLLNSMLQVWEFESWLYLSSTRFYSGLPLGSLATEATALPVLPGTDTVYDLSKLLGEAICLSQPRSTVRVARLSAVLGVNQTEDTFLDMVIAELRRTGKVVIHEAPDSSKDYITIDSVVDLLERIALGGRERIYNIASGTQVTHAAIAEKLAALTGAKIEFAPNGPRRAFPNFDVSRIKSEFGFQPQPALDHIGAMIGQKEP
jgi:nucleoside-diphosphate-sugar epimerase